MGSASRRARAGVVALALATVALTGCAAQAHSTPASRAPSASAAAASTPSAAPDVSIRRDVTVADGRTLTICITASVRRDTATEDAQTDERVAKARAILTDPKWETYPLALSDVPDDEQQQDHARGEDDAVILSGDLHDHIANAVQAAGLMGGGVSLAGHVGCP